MTTEQRLERLERENRWVLLRGGTRLTSPSARPQAGL